MSFLKIFLLLFGFTFGAVATDEVEECVPTDEVECECDPAEDKDCEDGDEAEIEDA